MSASAIPSWMRAVSASTVSAAISSINGTPPYDRTCAARPYAFES